MKTADKDLIIQSITTSLFFLSTSSKDWILWS